MEQIHFDPMEPSVSGPLESDTSLQNSLIAGEGLRGDIHEDGFVNADDAALAEEYLETGNLPGDVTPQGRTNFAAAWDSYSTLDTYDAEAVIYAAENGRFLGYNPEQCVEDITVNIDAPDRINAGEAVTLTASIDASNYADTWTMHWEDANGETFSFSNPYSGSFDSAGNVYAVYDSNDTNCQYYDGVSAWQNVFLPVTLQNY
ncbi:hypothetical protein GF362_06315 [Candidatus Dojkabacteria bacterium]|nr:hypothetical protein [Candidatus Dojkabacteria bacterium]